MLDDLQRIEAVDGNDMMSSLMGFADQVKDTVDQMAGIDLPEDYSRCRYVVIAGMGGSGIPGDFLETICRADCRVPILVHKDYGLPRFVGEDALVLAVSYSGTTEETLDAFGEAARRGSKIFGISGGDTLLRLLRERSLPHFIPPTGRTTRGSLGYLLFSLISVLERLGYIPDQSSNVAETISLLVDLAEKYSPNTATEVNEAKGTAAKLHGKTPVVYGSAGLTDVVALRWKQQMNENSKMFPQFEVLPEMTHNHLAAVVNVAGMESELCAVFLRNRHEGENIARRTAAAEGVLADQGIEIIDNWAVGESIMAGILTQTCLGDFVSFYLAVLNGVDPTPTKAMSELKKRLGLTDLTPQ